MGPEHGEGNTESISVFWEVNEQAIWSFGLTKLRKLSIDWPQRLGITIIGAVRFHLVGKYVKYEVW